MDDFIKASAVTLLYIIALAQVSSCSSTQKAALEAFKTNLRLDAITTELRDIQRKAPTS